MNEPAAGEAEGGGEPEGKAPGVCLNCGHQLDGRYCSRCGQQVRRPRLEVNGLAADALGELIGLDTKIGRTMIDFSRRPGRAALDYIGGHRVRYLNPIKYLIFSVAAYFLAMAALGLKVSDLYQPATPPPQGGPVATELVTAFQNIVNEALRSLLFAAPPVFAWVTNLLLGRRRFNFPEACSLWMFATAHSILLITLPALLLSSRFGAVVLFLAVVPSLLFYGWTARGFYGRGWVFSTFAVIVAYATFQLLLLSVMVCSVFVALWLSRS